jgi:hypothetical protein
VSHATALLLPDGRIFTAGGNFSADSSQIFKPPYLFDASGVEITPPLRPVIDSVPAIIYYGGSFTITSQQADDITAVNLLRLGSATHSFDFDQRFVALEFTKSENTITVAAPAHGFLAPPGYYMLFILKDGDRANVKFPSVAAMVELVSGSE